MSGNRRTVDVSGFSPSNNDYTSVWNANYRMILDFSEEGKSYWVIDTGASGDFLNKHYDD